MCNIAVISVHTSPLARPGTRDSGGMNVYIRELSRQLCRRAHTLDIFTRRTDPDSPQVTEIDGRTRVIQIDAGPPDAEKGSLQRYLPEFRCGVIRFQEEQGRSYDLVHSHYWLSGWVGQALKARWNVPHVIMFHTLGEAKNRSHLSEREPAHRIAGERLVAQGADRVICASEGERRVLIDHYGVAPRRGGPGAGGGLGRQAGPARRRKARPVRRADRHREGDRHRPARRRRDGGPLSAARG